MRDVWTPEYAPWRHGGWYVTNIHYPSGAVGCVSRNYADRKWRIVCSDAYPGSPNDRTFLIRDDAARAERELARDCPPVETQQTQLPPVRVASLAFPSLSWESRECGHIVPIAAAHVCGSATLPLDQPVNVLADPDMEPQPYDMPSPEADALDLIHEWVRTVRAELITSSEGIDKIAAVLRETGRVL
jgi:hypothetical protein